MKCEESDCSNNCIEEESLCLPCAVQIEIDSHNEYIKPLGSVQAMMEKSVDEFQQKLAPALQKMSAEEKIAYFTAQISSSEFPLASHVYLSRARAYKSLKNYKDAISDCTSILERAPDFLTALALRAENYSTIGQFEKSIEDYSTVMRLYPEHAHTYRYMRAVTYLKSGEYEKAFEEFSELLEERPASLSAWQRRGLTNAHLKRHEQALSDCNHAIEIGSQFPGPYLNRALVLSMMGNKRDALADFRTAFAKMKIKRIGLESDDTITDYVYEVREALCIL